MYYREMPRRRRALHDVQADRPTTPYLPDGTLDPREWKIACSAARFLTVAELHDEPWFVCARPVEVYGQGGVELQVVVRWLSSEVWKKVPWEVDGYVVDVVTEGQTGEIQTIH